MATSGLTPVPCLICYEAGVEVFVNVNPVTTTFTVEGGSIEFVLETVSITLDTAGLELERVSLPVRIDLFGAGVWLVLAL